MSREILLLTGSPRKDGNCMALAESFKKGALKAGHKVTQFDAAQRNVGGCTACHECWSTGTPCIIDDDFNLLEPVLERADTLVQIMPLYFYGIPAQIKAVFDKFNAYEYNCTKPLKIEDSLLIGVCADYKKSAFDGVVATHRLASSYMGWNNLGEVLITGVSAPGAVVHTKYIKEIETLAKKL